MVDVAYLSVILLVCAVIALKVYEVVLMLANW